MVRPRARRQFNTLNVERVELGGSLTPVVAPLMLYPCEVPSGTKEAGEVWYDDDNNVLAFYNGTAIREVSNAPAGQAAVPNFRPFKSGATVLVANDGGAFCVWTAAAGYTFTLPALQPGLWFDFHVRTLITSVGAKIVTASASEFLVGNYIQSTDVTYTSANHVADGTTIRSWNGNGSTTGGLAGDWVRVHYSSATTWGIYGMGRATGTEATPFATS